MFLAPNHNFRIIWKSIITILFICSGAGGGRERRPWGGARWGEITMWSQHQHLCYGSCGIRTFTRDFKRKLHHWFKEIDINVVKHAREFQAYRKSSARNDHSVIIYATHVFHVLCEHKRRLAPEMALGHCMWNTVAVWLFGKASLFVSHWR